MGKSIKKYLSLILAMLMIFTLFAGCVTDAGKTPEATQKAESSAKASTQSTVAATPENATYPLVNNGETLTLWTEFPGFLSGNLNTYEDQVVFQKAQEITGVNIDFIEVSMFVQSDQFNLMCASGELADMIAGGSSLYTGGSVAALEDDIFIDLDPYVKKDMGNYWELLSQNKNALKRAYNDNGQMAEIIGLSDAYYPTSGAQIRKDWLDKLSLEIPQTYDELHNVLLAFKKEFNCSDTIMMLGSTQQTGTGLVGGFGTAGASVSSMGSSNAANMYQIDGVIHNGYLDDSYKEYLMMINQWYNEGIINPDFYSQVNDPMAGNADALILNGQSGLWYAQSNFIGDYMGKATEPGFKIAGITEPVKVKGEKWHFGSDGSAGGGKSVSVSTKCKNPDLAAKWLDFWFSEQGQVFCNYGIEGQSFVYDENGKPKYTDLVTKNPNLIYQFAIVMYTMSAMPTYAIADRNWSSYTQDTIDAMKTYADTQDSLYSLPSINLTAEESEEYSKLFTDINTYANENLIRYVIGEKSFDKWDEFVNQVNKMGLKRCIEIYQTALDRYNSR